MPDIADEAQGAEELLIEQGLTHIRSQFSSSSSEYCKLCGDIIPERRQKVTSGRQYLR